METILSIQFCCEPTIALRNKIYYFWKNQIWNVSYCAITLYNFIKKIHVLQNQFLFFPLMENQLSHYKEIWVPILNDHLITKTNLFYHSNWFSLMSLVICQDFKIHLQIKPLAFIVYFNFNTQILDTLRCLIPDNKDLAVIISFLSQDGDDTNVGAPVATYYFPQEKVGVFDNSYLDYT